ncbi:MAG: ribonuclease P protein component 1 [Nitrososphaerales archaeon]
MKITPSNLIYHELIGLKVRVYNSPNKYLLGLIGKVAYETKNMLLLEKDGKIKKIPKFPNIFEFYLDDNTKVYVNGRDLLSRPEDRLKRL